MSAHVVQAESDAGFATGCDSNAAAPKVGDEAIGFQVRYEGFTADAHQDTLVEVGNLDTKTVVGLTDTNSQYPFKWDAEGCVTVSVPLDEGTRRLGELPSAGAHRTVVQQGPDVALQLELEQHQQRRQQQRHPASERLRKAP